MRHPIRIISIISFIVGIHLFRVMAPGQSMSDTLRPHSDTAGVSIPKLAVVGGITLGGFIYGHVLQSNLWWKGEESSFHFDWDRDWKYALGSDKFGHAYFPYLMSNIYRQAFIWIGFDSLSSTYYSSGLAMTYQTYIEIRDGFSKEWGFSWGDFGADLIGTGYPLLQQHVPILRAFSPKISYYPSDAFRAGAHKAIIDDYESTYDWLSIDVHELLPKEWRKYYPAFVNIALGHSVKGLDRPDGGHHELYIALDWNLDALPDGGWFWNLMKLNINFYHLPSPAVRISPGLVWYGIHF
jgi:hypothetical protein